MQPDSRILWLTLALLSPEVSCKTLWKLYNAHKSIENLFLASEKDILNAAKVDPIVAKSLKHRKTLRDPCLEMKKLSEKGISFITWEDENYPAPLRHILDPPLFLFARGSYTLDNTPALAIVGTRKASVRGLIFAEKLAFDLASMGITVVSGLAIGIDTAAHRGALKGQGKTIGVMGSGLDVPYPRTNEDLMEQIPASGALFSEYPLGTRPDKWRFPMRNRIVSGLALGVVVVEAGIKSGALITAKMAMEQGREVFAVPSAPSDYRGAGTNRLIKEGAKLVESIDDILEELGNIPFGLLNTTKENDTFPKVMDKTKSMDQRELKLSDKETIVLNHLAVKPQHIDALCEKTGLSSSELLSLLTLLEIKKLVVQFPGKYFAVAR